MKQSLFTSVLLLTASLATLPAHAQTKWPEVPPMDWSKTKPADFADAELTIPFYLDNFFHLANSVIETPTADLPRGWFSKPIWRDDKFNFPYNARVLESYTTLAYFYTTHRPWNIYYGSPAVRARLEAVLELWLSMQGPLGQFSEYATGPKGYNLPATAFATKFMGRTLELLKAGGDATPIDPDLLKRVIAADRKACVATMTIPQFYKDGRVFSNQFENVFGGAALYAGFYKDPEIATLLHDTLAKALTPGEFQSPAGFLYENNSSDFGYTLHTTHSNMVQAYHWAKNTPTGKLIEDQERKWTDWISYNLLREPDGSTFFLNRAIESRQTHIAWTRQPAPWGQAVPLALAFAASKEELETEAKVLREKLTSEWGKPQQVRTGDGTLVSLHKGPASEPRESDGQSSLKMEPYAVFDLDHYDDYIPTAAERDAAVAKLPYLAKDNFNHQRSDSRYPLVSTYIRRPAYYAAFNTGKLQNPHQRFGLGILWSPTLGTVLQSQTKTTTECWGTVPAGSKAIYECKDLNAQVTIDGKPIPPKPGATDLPQGTLTATYPLGTNGTKTLTFADTLAVSIKTKGDFTEQLPLLLPEGTDLTLSPGKATLTTPKGSLTITFPTAVTPITRNIDSWHRAGKHLVVLNLPATDSLDYTFTFSR